MAHNHNYALSGRSNAINTRPLKITLAIVLSIMVAEVVGGLVSNSLALLGDAGHMLVDALSLGLALFALMLSRRPPTPDKTYGYYRVEIMAALANGILLVLISIYLFYEAYQRFLEPPVVQTPIMLVVAAVGLVANIIGMILLGRATRHSLNIKAAFWHIIGDTISSLGVIIGGIIITVTGRSLVDPIIAVIIGCIILWGAMRIVREAVDILLMSVPKHVSVDRVAATIKSISGVVDTHDIHIWTVTSGIYDLSAHVQITDQSVSSSADIVTKINNELAKHHKITHTTLQLECEQCPSGVICTISNNEH